MLELLHTQSASISQDPRTQQQHGNITRLLFTVWSQYTSVQDGVLRTYQHKDVERRRHYGVVMYPIMQ